MSDSRGDVESKTAKEVQASTSSAHQQNPIREDQASTPSAEQHNPTQAVKPTSSIQKADIDSLEELFEWLPIEDLLALRVTCERLKLAVDYFIRANYPTIRIGSGRVVLSQSPYLYTSFDEFRNKDAVSLKMVDQMTVLSDNLRTKEIDAFSGVLHQVERFQIEVYTVAGGFYESILKLCTKLSYLGIRGIEGDKIIGENDWLLRHYPTLKHIELDDNDQGECGWGGEVVVLREFFELNPNIQIFSTTFHYFYTNRNCWRKSNIKLDRLDLQGYCYRLFFDESNIVDICDLLNELYEQGFYKRLHLYPEFLYKANELNLITSVGGLEKLYLWDVYGNVTLLPTPRLHELCIHWDWDFDKLQNPIDCFANVERVFFEEIIPNKILHVVRYAPKVKQIKANKLKKVMRKKLNKELPFKDNVLDVVALNNARKQLAGACKTTIYVDEAVFLATKWAYIKTRFDLVEIKRHAAVEWTHQRQQKQ